MHDGHTSLNACVQEVSKLLSSLSLLEVTRGLRLVGEQGLSELSPRILPFLRDSRYYELRAMSARSCGVLRLSSALSDLHFLARHDEYEEVRSEAVLALGLLHDPSSLSVLYLCLSDGDESVRSNVLSVLKRWKDRAKVIQGLVAIAEDTTASLEFRRDALWALVQFCDSSLFHLFVSFLDHEDMELSRIAVEGLGVLGDPRGVSFLRDLLACNDDDFRFSVYSALGSIVSPESAELLRNGVSDSYDYIRQEIARSMSRFAADHALPILASLMRDDVVSVRSDAVRSLSSFSGSRVIALLAEAIIDPSASVRKAVAYSLGFQGKAGIALVRKLLGDDDDLVRIVATTTLSRLAEGG